MIPDEDPCPLDCVMCELEEAAERAWEAEHGEELEAFIARHCPPERVQEMLQEVYRRAGLESPEDE